MKPFVPMTMALLLASALGCNGTTDSDAPERPPASNLVETPTHTPASAEPSDETPARVQADESTEASDVANAVAALKTSGAQLKHDGDGAVVEVSFRGTSVGDDALEPLASLPRLRSLLLNDTAITDAGLATLGTIATLENLDLRGCAVSNDGMAHLAGLKKLRGLKLAGSEGKTTVDDDGLAALAELTELKAVALDKLWVSEVGLAHLKNSRKLEELYLAGTLVGDETPALLAEHFPRLKKLRISQTGLCDAGMDGLANLKALESLDISECASLSDAGMEPLAELTNLAWLNLWRAPVTDAGVAHLAGLVNMRWLNLDNTQLTDAGLVHLKGMTQLEFLHLGSTAVSDAGMPALEPLVSLKDLKVTRTAVTAKGVEKLRETLPETVIQLKYIQGQ